MQQPHYPLHPQIQGENFHLVGQSMTLDPISPIPPPPPPPSAYATGRSQGVKQCTSTKETRNIDIEQGDNSEANMVAKKRYWTHEEEERLVILVFSFLYFDFCMSLFRIINALFIFAFILLIVG